MIDISKMSKEAKKLINEVGDTGDVQAYLDQHPECQNGLNDFIKWRVYQAERVSKETSQPRIGHNFKR
ncbi:MAG: hypothetical protein COU22_00925 [Candidatus Komeilibacteria bacterium CG10_big_fil_rev_8_21_14_0_10_41_13]|uniref:Uncharacterized protein n=1 Tax=Candidatus Komeilibacteria bacterium CG10_big_fil_rev_8_21_14_0_10_41_13 TaxID=1974476 RepID=A0A2M6WCZ1_9BACT|nr:MAG: hypothetical protein COU22_00925 [Candidatus Komeilibacteria bacterium CG10_big_fil_rev_8_21_14_0_10_41_13]